jgi:hypothetical protein
MLKTLQSYKGRVFRSKQEREACDGFARHKNPQTLAADLYGQRPVIFS